MESMQRRNKKTNEKKRWRMKKKDKSAVEKGIEFNPGITEGKR